MGFNPQSYAARLTNPDISAVGIHLSCQARYSYPGSVRNSMKSSEVVSR